MAVELKEMTPNLEAACIRMQLHSYQDGFVDPPGETLDEAEKFKKSKPLVVVADEIPVGMLMYEGLNKENTEFLIWGFMIDREHQQKGYGTQAMELLMEKLKKENGCKRMEIAYVPENQVVRQMYQSLGFQDTGKLNSDSECLMEWIYNPDWD